MVSAANAAANRPPLKLLAVSFTYAPSALPRAVQVARLLKHLPASTTLVCADYDEKDVRKDPALVAEAESFLERAVRVPFRLPGWKNRAGGLAYRLNLPVWDKTPDRHTSWKRPVLDAVAELVRGTGYSPHALVTFGAPMSDHLIGLELKRRYRWPWVAHFSDPWVDNPFSSYDPLTRALNSSLERRVVNGADRVVFTSEETLELVMAKYPEEFRPKARVLPHAFDPELFGARAEKRDSQLTVRYLGDLYGRRTPGPLFDALSRLLAADAEALTDVRFELIGPTYDLELEKLGLGNLPEGLVAVKAPVTYRESLSLMASADGLLVIDAPAEKSVFLPSKLIDYVGAGRPVLGLTPPGTSANLIDRLGGWVARPDDVESMAAVIKNFLAYLRGNRNQAAPWGTPGVQSLYEARRVALRFEAILRELTGPPG
ncbi:MAG TPA: glycosyltransferase [Pyrinomonadaceae bacterium]|nr:glycosyltransferase [Pyrinomonadaceae bacterium]